MPHRDDTDAEALMKRIQYHRYGDSEAMRPFLMKKPQPLPVIGVTGWRCLIQKGDPPAVWFAYSLDRKGVHLQHHLRD
jgi:hypothetical protein